MEIFMAKKDPKSLADLSKLTILNCNYKSKRLKFIIEVILVRYKMQKLKLNIKII